LRDRAVGGSEIEADGFRAHADHHCALERAMMIARRHLVNVDKFEVI